jgi:small-conductance mechanosensitive channel
MKTITIEQLAEKLNKQIWSKGDLKRIYLNDAGWNTKKMSTKTFIFQDENSNFKVSCKIDCPSQSYNWIDSQEKEVKESVYEDIERAVFEIENPGTDYDDFVKLKKQK